MQLQLHLGLVRGYWVHVQNHNAEPWYDQVSVLGACLGEPAQACLIMELVEGGSLAARIHDRKKRRLTYMQILQASRQDVRWVLSCLPEHPNALLMPSTKY
jgi:hypothetical protein